TVLKYCHWELQSMAFWNSLSALLHVKKEFQTMFFQNQLHAPKVLRRGAWPGFAVHANVWMGQANTPVEYRIDDGAWQPMSRELKPDPAVLAENALDDAAPALRGYDRLPEAATSTHLWRGTLPTNLDVGTHAIEVRARLEGFGSASARTSYQLRDAAP
ncbi:MAG: calcineurin-like phosphoesterase C-terminal domain-containing protein, partial [Arenimonas sp.]